MSSCNLQVHETMYIYIYTKLAYGYDQRVVNRHINVWPLVDITNTILNCKRQKKENVNSCSNTFEVNTVNGIIAMIWNFTVRGSVSIMLGQDAECTPAEGPEAKAKKTNGHNAEQT